jgi:hypothetical protein
MEVTNIARLVNAMPMHACRVTWTYFGKAQSRDFNADCAKVECAFVQAMFNLLANVDVTNITVSAL